MAENRPVPGQPGNPCVSCRDTYEFGVVDGGRSAQQRIAALEAALARARAEAALRSIECVPWTGEKAARWWDTQRMPAIAALNQLATRAGADAGDG